MDFLSNLPIVLRGILLTESLTIVVCLIGAVLAVVKWRRFPKVCLMVLLAILLTLADVVVLSSAQTMLTWHYRDNHQSVELVRMMLFLMETALEGAALALFISAAFVSRASTVAPPPVSADRGTVGSA